MEREKVLRTGGGLEKVRRLDFWVGWYTWQM